MPTDNERKALWFLAIVALSGTSVRVYRAVRPDPMITDSVQLAGQIDRVDSVRSARRAGEGRAKGRSPATRARTDARKVPETPPPAPPGPLDLDQASAAEIETLPGVGPALAARIVQHRDSAGPFGHLDALCQVRGVGPGLARKLRPLVTFTAPRRPVSDSCDDPSRKVRKPRATRVPDTS